jgi:AAA domain
MSAPHRLAVVEREDEHPVSEAPGAPCANCGGPYMEPNGRWPHSGHAYKPRSYRMAVVSRESPAATGRHLRLTQATGITPRRVRWAWDGRLALGTLSLVGGREGSGKTLLTNVLTSQVTRGTLPGELAGHPRNVIVVTTEDAWEFTVVPRLMANGADLSRVYRAEAVNADGIVTGLSLPHDLAALEAEVIDKRAALVVLDPLMSRLDGNLDTHKDAEVRLALEPIVALAERTGVHIAGLIHVNKSGTTDPLTSLMASRAFAAVARHVLFVMRDPEDRAIRLVGQPKNSLGKEDMPTLRFGVVEVTVGQDPEDARAITAPQLQWLTDSTTTVDEALSVLATGGRRDSKKDKAARWLVDYLQGCPDGKALSSEVKAAATAAGHEHEPLRRAREGSDIEVISEGFPAVTYWQLPLRLIPTS